jgi:Xaa-Pro aminopeptidase
MAGSAPLTGTNGTGARLTRLRAELRGAGLEAALIGEPANRTYLSGFTGSTGWLLITQSEALFAADSRYWGRVGLECPGFELVKFGVGGGSFSAEGLPRLLERAGARQVAFEADHVTYAEAQAWMGNNSQVEWVPLQGLVRPMRAVKDPPEIATLRAAVALADEALAAALVQVRPGMTERELAWLIESNLRTHGAEDVAFDTIVGAGPNGAQPHHNTGEARLMEGEPVVIDMGARLRGYHSDLTRTICLGQPRDPERFWNVYNTVLRAQIAAEAGLQPGMTGHQADALARDVIVAAGYGEYFGHGLGHGVGLAIHEDPFFRPAGQAQIKPGNVVTVEPGIYLPDWGGVRIEDIVLITDNGAELLTKAPKQPII